MLSEILKNTLWKNKNSIQLYKLMDYANFNFTKQSGED